LALQIIITVGYFRTLR